MGRAQGFWEVINRLWETQWGLISSIEDARFSFKEWTTAMPNYFDADMVWYLIIFAFVAHWAVTRFWPAQLVKDARHEAGHFSDSDTEAAESVPPSISSTHSDSLELKSALTALTEEVAQLRRNPSRDSPSEDPMSPGKTTVPTSMISEQDM